MLRKLFILLCAGGGVYGAGRLIELLANRASLEHRLNPWSGESVLLMVPMLLVGALFGAMIGGMLLPRKLN